FDPANNNMLLRLPLPLEGKQVEGFVGYRLDAADVADKAQGLGLTSLAPEVFGQHWKAAGQRDTGLVTRAFSFRRSGAAAALALSVAPVRPRVSQEVTWIVGRNYADFSANVEVESPAAGLIELIIPPAVTVAEIKGPQIHHWSRQGAVTQIWL